MENLPKDSVSIGAVMSNCDHSIEEDAEEKLKTGNVFGEYPAWNFWSAVWWDNEKSKFIAVIKQFGTHVDTIACESLQEIMDTASIKYGSS